MDTVQYKDRNNGIAEFPGPKLSLTNIWNLEEGENVQDNVLSIITAAASKFSPDQCELLNKLVTEKWLESNDTIREKLLLLIGQRVKEAVISKQVKPVQGILVLLWEMAHTTEISKHLLERASAIHLATINQMTFNKDDCSENEDDWSRCKKLWKSELNSARINTGPSSILSSSNIQLVQKHSFFAEYTQSKRSWSMTDTQMKNKKRDVKTQTLPTETAESRPRQYSIDILSDSTQLLYSGRRSYKLLRLKKLLQLPHPSTIYRHLSSFVCLPGINEQLLRLVSLRVETYDEEDRIVSISVDEIHLLGDKWSWSAQQQTLYPPKKVNKFIFTSMSSSYLKVNL